LKQSCTVFCGNVRNCDLRINHINLRICHSRTGTPKKFAESGLSPRICGFAICGLLTKVCLPTSDIRWTFLLFIHQKEKKYIGRKTYLDPHQNLRTLKAKKKSHIQHLCLHSEGSDWSCDSPLSRQELLEDMESEE
jgi:hypothetical protein